MVCIILHHTTTVIHLGCDLDLLQYHVFRRVVHSTRGVLLAHSKNERCLLHLTNTEVEKTDIHGINDKMGTNLTVMDEPTKHLNADSLSSFLCLGTLLSHCESQRVTS